MQDLDGGQMMINGGQSLHIHIYLVSSPKQWTTEDPKYFCRDVTQTKHQEPQGSQVKTRKGQSPYTSIYLVVSPRPLHKDQDGGQLKTHGTYLVASHLYLPGGMPLIVLKNPDNG